MADELGPGSKPKPKLATNEAEAKRNQEDGLELLLALLATLGLRGLWDFGVLDIELKRRALDALIQETSSSLVSLTRDLASRKITPRTWLLRMRDILVTASAAGALLMLGKNEFDDDEEKEWISEINLQYGYLVRFFDEVRDARQILNQGAVGRSDLYARALWSTSWRVFTAAWVAVMRKTDGFKLQVLRHLALADHCHDCVAWAADGWVDYDSEDFHAIGTSVCGARCLCSLEFRMVPTNQEAG